MSKTIKCPKCGADVVFGAYDILLECSSCKTRVNNNGDAVPDVEDDVATDVKGDDGPCKCSGVSCFMARHVWWIFCVMLFVGGMVVCLASQEERAKNFAYFLITLIVAAIPGLIAISRKIGAAALTIVCVLSVLIIFGCSNMLKGQIVGLIVVLMMMPLWIGALLVSVLAAPHEGGSGQLRVKVDGLGDNQVDSKTSFIDDLERLARLKDSGALTEDEYNAEKRRLIEKRHST